MLLRMKYTVVLLSAFITLAAQNEPRKTPPDYEKKMAAIKNFEAGVVPLFVVGDLNEDGAVDNTDLALLQQYLENKIPSRATTGITCLAAADLNMNGRVEDRDIALLRDILKHGAVLAPALSHRSRLSCDYRNFILAAGPAAAPGGSVPIHFLDSKLTPSNSSGQMVAGDGTISASSDGFVVRVAQTAEPGSSVTVRLMLAGGKKYIYTIAVIPAPRPLR